MQKEFATIFNIQKYSIHDGPGIRTTVFFKGCPLSCKWCHNPESISNDIQIIRNEVSCTLCGSCVIACPTKALKMEEDFISFDRSKCDLCGRCEEVCYHNAIKIVGREMSVDEVFAEVLKDKVFYEESGGGVTFSGGEPLFQPNFLKQIAKKCREEGIHTALDTSGFARWEVIKEVLPYIDLVLYDLKSMKDEIHREYVGVSNKLILENLRRLGKEDVDIFLRLPIIKGVNDSLTDGQLILDFIEYIDNIKQINILEYHKMGMEKYPRLGKKYELTGNEKPSKDYIEDLTKLFERKDYKVVVGG